ncbi:hypothetical protein AXY43_06020 [Clostridium sp. MF28]|nr:hypothetical protein AXY43_06020 [Clostridium sp. MF28]OVE70181.1 hypothetical protein CCS79_04020 [Clostridium diolis]PSM56108.1 hypothetical protein C4L39_19160 [Clostridium diolis]
MFKCPHCKFKTITLWKKVGGDSRFTKRITCPYCFRKSKLPWWSFFVQMIFFASAIPIFEDSNFRLISAFGIVIYSMIVIVVIPALFPLKKLK